MKGFELGASITKLPFDHKLYKGIYSLNNLPRQLAKDRFIIVHRETTESGHW